MYKSKYKKYVQNKNNKFIENKVNRKNWHLFEIIKIKLLNEEILLN